MSSAIYPSLLGKRVVITGGGTGIGAGLVAGFARQGSEVVFLDIQEDESRTLVAALRDAPIQPVFRRCDLTDLDAITQTFADVGPVDVLINNAANDDRHAIAEVTPAYWENRMAVNLRHAFFCSKAVVEGMKALGGGAIINFGSISWHLGIADLVLYETAKAGIEGMTTGLARELGPFNIRVTCIVPGNVKTPRQSKWHSPDQEKELVASQCLPVRIMPEHVASLALFLASDDGAVLTGQNYWIAAGWR
jgi:NAD(P)-dependent dehydrogenase (short-subunit alcohol dehydrogenase family)